MTQLLKAKARGKKVKSRAAYMRERRRKYKEIATIAKQCLNDIYKAVELA